MLSRESVLSFLRMHGPSLPAQIKKALGGDTFIVGALLSELKTAGAIRVSTTKRGGSPFYYVPEHFAQLANFVEDLSDKDKRTALHLKEKKVLRDKILDPLMRVSLRQIKDFAVPVDVKLKEGAEVFWKWFLTPNNEVEVLIKGILGIKPPVQTPEKQETLVKTEDSFLQEVQDYFKKQNITLVEHKIIRKNSEVECLVSIPSAVGRLDFFCKAKKKKRCNDGDLSTAYLKGQNRRLPVLFITTGSVTKKALEMLRDDFKGMVVKEMYS